MKAAGADRDDDRRRCLAAARAWPCAPPEVHGPAGTGGTTTTAGSGPTTRRPRRDDDHDDHDDHVPVPTTTCRARPSCTRRRRSTGGASSRRACGDRVRRRGRDRRATRSTSAAIFATPCEGRRPRTAANFMAVNLTNGNLLPFVADTNGQRQRRSPPTATSLYIGGTFTTVKGVPEPAWPRSTWRPARSTRPSSPTSGLGRRHGRGRRHASTSCGEFNTVNGVDPHAGRRRQHDDRRARSPRSTRRSTARCMAVAASPDGSVIYLGGNFTNGRHDLAADYLAKVNATTGAVQGPIFARSTTVVAGPVGRERRRAPLRPATRLQQRASAGTPTTGKRRLGRRADGDTQAVQYSNGLRLPGLPRRLRGRHDACACWRWRRPTARSTRRSTRLQQLPWRVLPGR